MQTNARTLRVGAMALSLDRIHRTHRSVTVQVVDGDREVDRLQASTPWLLRASLRPVYRRLRPDVERIRFSGVEERWLPGGFRRSRTEVALRDLTSALVFLSGSGSPAGEIVPHRGN